MPGRINRDSGLFFCVAAALLSAPQEAFAYLDPGTGSILLQGVIAALSAAMVSISLGWQHVKHAFMSIRNRFCRPSVTPPSRNEPDVFE